MNIPKEIVTLIGVFAPLFSDRVWVHAQILLLGAILSGGPRTVTAALRVMGLSAEKNWSKYHRVLSRARWSALEASRILLWLIVTVFVAAGAPIILAADDTLERRRGKQIKAKGCYRDTVRSSKKHVVKSFGLKWVTMAVLVAVPWSSRIWALPFLTVLAPSEKANQKAGKRHKTSVDWVRQMIKQVRRWWPARALIKEVGLSGGKGYRLPVRGGSFPGRLTGRRLPLLSWARDSIPIFVGHHDTNRFLLATQQIPVYQRVYFLSDP
jgi:hypothetical protein